MTLFLLGILILIAGYFFYGKLVENILQPDDRETPAVRLRDGVDFMVLPHWKNMLIQLLNIAGIGPVIGVILGIKFGVIVFVIIPVGNIIGGAVHDFLAGMMSLRGNGANLPKLIGENIGRRFYYAFSGFMVLLLLLVVAVFINIPAQLSGKLLSGTALGTLLPGNGLFWAAVAVIFLYYVLATLFPIDKIIGSLYPVFGGMLLLGTLLIFIAMCCKLPGAPELLKRDSL